MRLSKTKLPKTKLQNVRINWGMITQKQLAQQTGIPLWKINLYERGKLNINDADNKSLKLLRKTLDCSLSDILEDE